VNYPYWVALGLVLLGLYTMIGHRNLMKKVIGMSIFQTAIILFFLVLSIKRDASLPVVPLGPVDPQAFVNPLPHALMLTAIVVMVATLGVALAILIRLHARYGTLEEDVLAERIAAQDTDAVRWR
jgi:multicomponent Na+:H+ antiporter subunit C